MIMHLPSWPCSADVPYRPLSHKLGSADRVAGTINRAGDVHGPVLTGRRGGELNMTCTCTYSST